MEDTQYTFCINNKRLKAFLKILMKKRIIERIYLLMYNLVNRILVMKGVNNVYWSKKGTF